MFVTELETTNEYVLWIKVDKDLIGVEFILGALSIPHEGTVHFDQDAYDNIANDIKNVLKEF